MVHAQERKYYGSCPGAKVGSCTNVNGGGEGANLRECLTGVNSHSPLCAEEYPSNSVRGLTFGASLTAEPAF